MGNTPNTNAYDNDYHHNSECCCAERLPCRSLSNRSGMRAAGTARLTPRKARRRAQTAPWRGLPNRVNGSGAGRAVCENSHPAGTARQPTGATHVMPVFSSVLSLPAWRPESLSGLGLQIVLQADAVDQAQLLFQPVG